MINLWLAILLALGGHTLSWFQSNSQFTWKYWVGKPLLAAIAFGLPSSILFWYATNYSYRYFGALWNTRFLMFGMSYVSFPLMTYVFAGESLFTARNLTCTALSFLIVLLQVFWK